MPIKMKVNSQQISMTVDYAKVIYPKDTATYILRDEDGNEVVGVVSDEKVVFTATENDIRDGKIAATGEGVTTGTKVIPAYHTTETVRTILNGSEAKIPLPVLDTYDYTKLQVIICKYNTNISDSVDTEKVVINDNVYNVKSTEIVSTVRKDDTNKEINLGFINNSGAPIVLRCLTYKEIE